MTWTPNTKHTLHIAIDPGRKGAICFLRSRKDLRLVSMPETDEEIQRLLTFPFPNTKIHVLFEKVWGRPNDGGSRAFTFGDNNGFLRATLLSTYSPSVITYVLPTKWQRYFELPTSTQAGSHYNKKKAHREKAQQLFPWMEPKSITQDNADALLIALYAHAIHSQEK